MTLAALTTTITTTTLTNPKLENKKPKRKIIRKKKPIEKDNNPIKSVSVSVIHTNTDESPQIKPKKSRKIIRKSKPKQKEPELPSVDLGSGSEDDIEYVFTVSWYHRNKSYLLDENTQEVFNKKNHSLVGMRYINEDELSVIDFDYANNSDS